MRATLGDIELFYLTHGRGPPVMVMHGGPGLDHTYLRPWLDGIAANATLIYHDARGHGRSGRRIDLSPTTLRTWADDAEALRQHLGHERLVVLGHGFGGFAAQIYAQAYPERTQGLILCDCTPAFDYPQIMLENAQRHATAEQLGHLIALLSHPVADDQVLRRLWKSVLSLYFYRYDPKTGGALDEAMSYSAAAYNHGLFTLASALNTLPLLKDIHCPTLVLVGRHDWLMPPPQAAERLVQGIARAELVVFEESGHYPFIEEPVGFCKVVRGWLRDLWASTNPM